jgi:MoaA/NifB/PqqE/SkfB family radical SAM enzyme
MGARTRHDKNMDVDYFERVIDRIGAEAPGTDVHLYNWGEPLLHPQLPEMIEKTKAAGLRCYVSSNLNVSADRVRAVAAAAPDFFRVSVSGHCPDTYERTHAGGQARIVQENMRVLAEELGADNSVDVEVFYHLYVDNGGEDLEAMKALSDELGFRFSTCWAHLMPIEQQLAYLDGEKLSDEAAAIVELLAVKPDESRAVALASADGACRLQQDQLVINTDGTVHLCCAMYGDDGLVSRDFLGAPWTYMRLRKRFHSYCGKCRANGIHSTVAAPMNRELAQVAVARIEEAGEPVPKVLPTF